jgi:hypothetical protein
MFLKLFSIEWTRLTRRTLFWFTLVICSLFIWLSLENFYTLNRVQILDGSLKLPGVPFDLANSLDQLLIVALPFIILIVAMMLGNDYSQRTNQHWLMRSSRTSSLIAKFSLLVITIFLLQWITLLVGGLTGWYFKTFTYSAYSLANVNWTAVLSATLYMTLVTLPYAALMLLVTVVTRSAFASIAIGLGYTQFIEFLTTGIFYGAGWSKWMMRNLYYSATYSLNAIGNKTVDIPSHLLQPVPAFVTAAVYTLTFLSLAIWLYRRQDIGG